MTKTILKRAEDFLLLLWWVLIFVIAVLTIGWACFKNRDENKFTPLQGKIMGSISVVFWFGVLWYITWRLGW